MNARYMVFFHSKKIYFVLLLAVMTVSIVFLFMPAFRGEIAVPQDIKVGGLEMHLYSFFVAIGIFAGYAAARSYALAKGIGAAIFDGTALALVVGGFVGAKFFYLLGSPVSAFSISGGFAFYGALLGGLAVLAGAWKYYRFRLGVFVDSLALGLPLGQAIGRLGNFFNQEAYGAPTALPWKMYVAPGYRPPGLEEAAYYHPAFLYEMIGLLILFAVLFRLRNKAATGVVFGVYAVGAGVLRSGIEELRVDALRIGSLMISQLAAIVLITAGMTVLLLVAKNERKAA